MENLDERVAWGQAVANVYLPQFPLEHFQQYQRDTFEATLRWIPREPTVQGRPLPGPLALPPPQSLASTQQIHQLTAAFLQMHEAACLGMDAICPASLTGWRCDHLARPYGYDARNT
ncbi:Hypp4037 [Branchiostoma lanceolatum]|uniref:Hypp4037 protein n=1 Tax=Branchiostoma lanceolatum TaxID=7740 RepID=A0A8K0A446_BRALA|nr:Hypp4037 [Branchiostoma lanceolatum]